MTQTIKWIVRDTKTVQPLSKTSLLWVTELQWLL